MSSGMAQENSLCWSLVAFAGFEILVIFQVQGVANEMQKMRSDRYHTGVWEKDLEKQLVWMPDLNHSTENILELASWCWASRDGPKSFLSGLILNSENFEVINSVSLRFKPIQSSLTEAYVVRLSGLDINISMSPVFGNS